MTKIVVVTSGKGGVGKTTTSASFASGRRLQLELGRSPGEELFPRRGGHEQDGLR